MKIRTQDVIFWAAFVLGAVALYPVISSGGLLDHWFGPWGFPAFMVAWIALFWDEGAPVKWAYRALTLSILRRLTRAKLAVGVAPPLCVLIPTVVDRGTFSGGGLDRLH